MKVKCIRGLNSITESKIYEVLDHPAPTGTFVIINNDNVVMAYKKERFEIIKENENMKELTFREVIANIKEGEVWESNAKTIKLFEGQIFIIQNNKLPFDCGAIVLDCEDKKYKLKRNKVTFQEAFKAYEEGKEIESCVSNTSYCINIPQKILCVLYEEIKGKWYIN